MKYKLLYTLKAKKDLTELDKKAADRILYKLDFFVSSDEPLKYAKKLVDSKLDIYRFRVGDYRIIFDIDNQGNISVLLILRIKHRKEVYL